jgi:hypothetical protein
MRGTIGDNSRHPEDNTIQPFVTIGNNVVLWAAITRPSHQIKDHNFFTARRPLLPLRGTYCFLGVNATIATDLLAEGTLVGMSASSWNTEPWSVYKPTVRGARDSSGPRFLRQRQSKLVKEDAMQQLRAAGRVPRMGFIHLPTTSSGHRGRCAARRAGLHPRWSARNASAD